MSINELKKQPRLGMGAFDDFSKQVKNLGSSGAVNKLSKEIDAFAGSLTGFEEQLKKVNTLIGTNISEVAAMSAGVGRAQSYFKDFADATTKSIKNLTFLIESQKDLQKEFKLSSAGGFNFSRNLRTINKEIGIGDAKLFKYAAGLGKITGGFITSNKIQQKALGNLVKTQAVLQNNLQLSEEGAQNFELFSRALGRSGVESIRNLTEASKIFSDATGQDQTQIMAQMTQDIASMSADTAVQFGRIPGQLETATMKARLLGTTMGELSAVGDKLLNIESSIGTEMEYQQLTGHRLLTDSGKSLTNEYRMAQLQGDGVKQAELMQQFLEKEGDTLKNNYIARQKASELFGVDGAKLIQMNAQLATQKKLGVEALVAQAEGDMVKLEASLRDELGDNETAIQDVLAGVAKLDVKTPAERSADALEAIQSNIALTGQGGALADPSKGGGGAAFVAGLQESIDASLKFATEASKTFSDTNFIKGIGKLGIVSDRVAESVTPLKQLSEVLPGVVKIGVDKFTGAIDRLTKVVKDPYAVPDITGKATGGYISGAGSGTSDSIPARLSDGEYVINASATRRNKSLLDKINSGGPVGYAAGGAVTSNARMEGLLQSILVTLRGSNVMGDTSMNGRKRI
tara:strand:- start:362 stop:2251 length:1890 start_codon:yes stop_codon:yes gene_type:complete